ncbi:MAG: type II secretion system GspH family protein [Phycisphaerae bacterium]|nr:type II secretion system protein [Phycisphaerae bacterium]MCZ2399842.1 type II secretion system GspH family protein [Phycisphaerae bacterium]
MTTLLIHPARAHPARAYPSRAHPSRARKEPVAPIRLPSRSALPCSRRAFSLAEMMIALVILGLGLLFIAALLPVGVEYSRQTTDLAAADATVEYAFQSIKHYVRSSNPIAHIDAPGGPSQAFARVDNLFRPRRPGAGTNEQAFNLYLAETSDSVWVEPRIKVRPLIGANVDLTPGPGRWQQIVDRGESVTIPAAMRGVFNIAVNFTPPGSPLTDIDVTGWLPAAQIPAPFNRNAGLFGNPVLPSIVRVYPPVSADSILEPAGFLNLLPNQPPRRVLDSNLNGSETRKAADRRMVWLAFYRRASNDRLANAPGQPTRLSRGDPLLYEFIVVVLRRTSASHRFPVQMFSATPALNDFAEPAARLPAAGVASDTLVPEPWLVSIPTGALTPSRVAFPPPQNANGYFIDPRGLPPGPFADHGDRFLTAGFSHPARLRLTVSEPIGRLLPVNSYLIPAVNDSDLDGQTGYPQIRNVGFIPSDPDALPIYKVVERPDDTTVVLEGNGVYPWTLPNSLNAGQQWLFWVIPPAFTERYVGGPLNGQPIYERRSPIVTIARRTFRVPEVIPQ